MKLKTVGFFIPTNESNKRYEGLFQGGFYAAKGSAMGWYGAEMFRWTKLLAYYDPETKTLYTIPKGWRIGKVQINTVYQIEKIDLPNRSSYMQIIDLFQKKLDLNNMKVDAVKPTEYKSFKDAKKAHKLE